MSINLSTTYYYSCECGAVGSELFTHGEPLAQGHDDASGNCGDLYDYTCATCSLVRYRLDVRDYRIITKGKTPNKEGLGCTWGTSVSADLSFVSTKTEKAKIYLQISRDTREIKVTDFYDVTLNGVKLSSESKIPAYSARAWTTYDLICLGEYDVKEGFNSLVVSYTPQKTNNALANYNLAYNLLSVNFRGEGKYDFAHCKMCDGMKGCEETSCTHTHCECKEFDAYDARVLSDTAKNDTEKLIGGSAAGSRITYYIHSDKTTTADLYTNVSAITNSYEIDYTATWSVTVNGADVTSTTKHHNQNSTYYKGAADTDIKRYYIFQYEFVNAITLEQGVNKIEFTATGSEKLNFRGLGLKVTNTALSFAEYCPVCEKCADADCVLADKCQCGADAVSFLAVDEKVSMGGCFRRNKGVIGQNGYTNEGSEIRFTVNATEAANAELVVLISSNAQAQGVNEVYGLTVNGDEVTSEDQLKVGTRWIHYNPVSFGSFTLSAGANEFVISYRGSEANDAYNLLMFTVITTAGTLSL